MQLTQRDIERNRQADSTCEQVAEVRRELARLGAAQHARRAKLLRRLAELRAAQDALARL
jgi:methylmalonyl-CoA mutase cobalamin-binding subunit